MLSGTSMFLPLTIVLTVTSREADSASPRGVELPEGGLRCVSSSEPSLHRRSFPNARPGSRAAWWNAAAATGTCDAGRRSPLAGDGHGRHADRASLEERLGAGSERRPGGHDVVDEDDPAAAERGRRRAR